MHLKASELRPADKQSTALIGSDSPCDVEQPIHAPASIQPHGALVVVDPLDDVIVQVSANLGEMFGVEAADALGARAPDLLGALNWTNLHARLPVFGACKAAPAMRLATRSGASHPWASATIGRSACKRLWIEIEPRRDERGNQLRADGSDMFGTAQSVLTQMRDCRSVAELCDAAAQEMRRLTGFDRSMVYRFDREGHGEVVAESCDTDIGSLLGLRFPATDVPQVSRRLCLAQCVRVIPDMAYAPVPLLSDPVRGGANLDMSLCSLRSVSPCCRQYMTNMAVRATVVVALTTCQGLLWGLLSCHSLTPRGLSPETRALCELIGEVLSVLLASLSGADAVSEQLARERDVRAVAAALGDSATPIVDSLAAASPDLLRALRAAGAFIRVDGSVASLGDAPPRHIAEAAISAVLERADTPPYGLIDMPGAAASATDHLGAVLPQAREVPALAAGALVVPLPHGPNAAIAWFRPEVARSVVWAGNPDTPYDVDPVSGHLTPRASFEAWRQIVKGRSVPWTEADFTAAAEVKRLIGDAVVRRVEGELARLRNIDPLTGLPNRRHLQERLDALTAEQRGSDRTALIYIDLDRFKDVNDTLGHDAGDTLLVEIAARLTQALGRRFLLARLGGDEFAALSEGATLEEAHEAADRIRQFLDMPFKLAGRPYRATASVGVAHSSTVGCAGGALLKAADAAMYVAKRGGGNGMSCYTQTLGVAVARSFSLDQDLRDALRNGSAGLTVNYQPVVTVADGALRGFEALARWQHPERGHVPPTEFIPVAEASGLIGELGAWVLRVAIEEAAFHARHFSSLPMAPYIAVNVSPRQLAGGGFAASLIAALASSGVDPSAIKVEVTEAAIADLDGARELKALREAGIRVALDDFGTGYSSLSYLRQLPADIVKLDRSFLPQAKRGGDDPDDPVADERFMEAVVSVATRAGLGVIAEGVETEEQLAAAIRSGAAAVQGYLLSRPMPTALARALLSDIQHGKAPPWRRLFEAGAR
jgi:diguanylate cyclase (GGDEF)-like protein